MPGEEGWETYPLDIPDFRVHYWEPEDPATQSSTGALEEVDKLTWRVLAGEFGPVQSIALDGFHKYYDYVSDSVTGGAFFQGRAFDARQSYPRIHRRSQFYLKRVTKNRRVPNVVVTTWSEREIDDPDNPQSKSHEFPALPGKMSQLIQGEITCVLYCGFDDPKPGEKLLQPYWLLKRAEKVWGANVKVDPRYVEQLPVKIRADWRVLDKVLKSIGPKEGK